MLEINFQDVNTTNQIESMFIDFNSSKNSNNGYVLTIFSSILSIRI